MGKRKNYGAYIQAANVAEEIYKAGKKAYKTYRKVKKAYGKSTSQTEKEMMREAKHAYQIQHNDVKVTKWSLTLAPKKKSLANKLGEFEYISYIDDASYGNNPGLQKVESLCSYLTPTHFYISLGNGASEKFGFSDGLFNLNPYDGSSQKTLSNGVLGGVNSGAARIHIRQLEISNIYKNLSVVAADVDVYWCMAKKNNIDKYPLDVWAQDLVTFEKQNQTVPSTGTSVALSKAGYFTATFPGATPQDDKMFGKFFKIVHHDKFVLQPGGELTVNTYININKTVSQAFVAQLMQNQEGTAVLSDSTKPKSIAGVTVHALIVVKGHAVHNVAVDRMEYGHARVGFIGRQKVHWTTLPNIKQQPYLRTNGGQLVEAWTVGNEKIVTDTDQVVFNPGDA